MVKELVVAAVMAALSWKPRVIEGGISATVIDVTPSREPVGAPAPVTLTVDPDDAIADFFAAHLEWAEGEWVRVSTLMTSYRAMAKERGWPMVSAKYLSRRLVEDYRCNRAKIDRRAVGDGRPTVIRFPRSRRKEIAA